MVSSSLKGAHRIQIHLVLKVKFLTHTLLKQHHLQYDTSHIRPFDIISYHTTQVATNTSNRTK